MEQSRSGTEATIDDIAANAYLYFYPLLSMDVTDAPVLGGPSLLR